MYLGRTRAISAPATRRSPEGMGGQPVRRHGRAVTTAESCSTSGAAVHDLSCLIPWDSRTDEGENQKREAAVRTLRPKKHRAVCSTATKLHPSFPRPLRFPAFFLVRWLESITFDCPPPPLPLYFSSPPPLFLSPCVSPSVLPSGVQPHRERGLRRDEILRGGRQAARVPGGPHSGKYMQKCSKTTPIARSLELPRLFRCCDSRRIRVGCCGMGVSLACFPVDSNLVGNVGLGCCRCLYAFVNALLSRARCLVPRAKLGGVHLFFFSVCLVQRLVAVFPGYPVTFSRSTAADSVSLFYLFSASSCLIWSFIQSKLYLFRARRKIP